MPNLLDSLDKQILQHLSEGITSYQDLAKKCKVTRNTVYRRVAALESEGYINKITNVTVNYSKLDLGAVSIAFKLPQKDQDAFLESLKLVKSVKFLCKTFGSYDVVAFVLCEKGEEGRTINQLIAIGEKFCTSQVDTMVCFEWKKIDFTLFDELKDDLTTPAKTSDDLLNIY